jgi:hypothetical protein
LVRFNKDNKTNDNSSWNDSMLGDVILSAYINLLSLVAVVLSFHEVLVNVYWHIHHRCFSMVELQHAFKCKITNIFPIPKDGFTS